MTDNCFSGSNICYEWPLTQKAIQKKLSEALSNDKQCYINEFHLINNLSDTRPQAETHIYSSAEKL